VSAEWYDVPLSALLPRQSELDNLVVAVALAASSVAFSSARIESMLMGTGAAAGVVARLAAAAGCAVQDVAVGAVQAVRVLRRPGMTAERLAAIRARQMPDAMKRRKADVVIHSGLSRHFAVSAIRRLMARLRSTL
jgi:predicted Fe-Mo cluster-binding NifX family protein